MTTKILFDKSIDILENILKIETMSTISGVLDSDGTKNHGDESYTIAEVAAVNEFGSNDGRIPERSFIREPVDAIADKIGNESENAILKVVNGASAESIFHKIGNMMRNAQVKSIGGGTHLKNADSTRKRKRSSVPLFDNGILKNSIKYRVEK